MDTREYLIAKGHSPEAVVCNDWNQLNSDFDLEEMLEDYHQTKLNNLSQHLVSHCDDDTKDLIEHTKRVIDLIRDKSGIAVKVLGNRINKKLEQLK